MHRGWYYIIRSVCKPKWDGFLYARKSLQERCDNSVQMYSEIHISSIVLNRENYTQRI